MARPINRKGTEQQATRVSTTRVGSMTPSDKIRLDTLWGNSLTSPPTTLALSDDSPTTLIIGDDGSSGDDSRAARADHKHAVEHGDLDGGTLHEVATEAVAGFMSSEDKTRLNSLWDNPSSSSGMNPYVWGDSPSGTLNGVNRVFLLSQSPVPSSSLMLFRNGLLMESGSSNDYTLSGLTVTFTSPSIPTPYDQLQAHYTIGVTLYLHVYGESPSGAIDGINLDFTLLYSPQPTNSVQVFKNGLYQRRGSSNDYTLSGRIITFTSPSTPTPYDTIQVYYSRGANSY